MKKKIGITLGVVLLLIIGVLVAAPFFLKGKIAEIVKNKVNSSINATFNFAEADLSLFRSFPNATLTLNEISVLNKEPFLGDTLFAAKEVRLNLSIKELFKGAEEPIAIKSLILDGALVHIKIDAQENANYDIAIESASEGGNADSDSNFTLSLKEYAISNARINYDDFSSGMHLEISEMNHSGTGDLSLEKSELNTTTNALVSFEMDSTNYLNKNKVQLDAVIGIDLNESKYTFLKNEAVINQLPLVFEGFVKLNDTNQEVAISFQTPSSDFKNFLAVMPEAYSKNISDVKTTGNFAVSGEFKGVVDDTHIPTFNIKINSDNASFKYPDLPKSVTNVFIDTEITNTTGIVEDTYVDIRQLTFMTDQDKFSMTSKIRDLMGNTKVDAHMVGKMNLAHLASAYPVPPDLNLKGILNADIKTAFDMVSIEKKQYENTKTSGKLDLSGFEYKSAEMPNTVQIQKMAMTFNPKTVTLTEFAGVTGKTDFQATGTLQNLLGFLFNNEDVEGNFELASNTFSVSDFMVADTQSSESAASTTATESIKIPSFLDVTVKASANTVHYDNLTLKNVSGNLRIKDQKAVLTDMTSSIFDGKLSFNGEVSTKNETPTFAMNLGMNGFDIGETFKALALFDALAPVAAALQGRLNSDIVLSGNLNEDFTPNLATLSGNLLAELLSTELNPNQTKIMSELSGKLNFIQLDKLNLSGLKTALSFEDGLVKVKPFTLTYKDIAVNISGSHSFDKNLNYAATLHVPSKYLGNEVNSLIAKIDDKSLDNLTVPVTANIGGLYSSPTVTTDVTSGIKNLTAQLVEIEKQKLLNQGKGKANELIGSILAGKTTGNDSTTTSGSVNESVKDALGGLLGNTTQPKDTTTVKKDATIPKEDAVKEAAKEVLGGLFGSKKKKETTTTTKDSVN
ncbi:AsmA-like C-terminal region-containing protein [Arenibacter sp. GZD96]|uniref:AsmA-like C-terminal region-containing protein n=1 Tax=Aurantibrevibacter litoralis TaxID=3106030 RepID=UPI002AFDD1A4|nr:AsmA-like C-terminal region-containing protein [Arenibacter sp. GZD-96]MEA1784719.1 AsmA-like C-terminal region-containing protein [Arenibacter sp. GZD-96]